MTISGIVCLALLLAMSVVGEAKETAVGLGPNMDLGNNFNTLTEGAVSPHTKWAKPLPGGPIRALFIVPRSRARDAVELMQRVDTDHGSVLVYSESEFGHPTDRMVIKGATAPELADRMRRQLSRNVEAIVIGSVNWKTLPEEFQKGILDKVKGGCGLVFAYPDKDFEDALAAAGATAFPEPGLLDGLALEHVVPFRDMKDPTSAVRNSATLFRLGRGRISVVRYGSAKPWAYSSLTPDSPNLIDHEYQMALLTRVLVEVSGRSRTVVSLSGEPPGVSLKVSLASPTVAGKKSSVVVGVQNYEGETAFEKQLTPTAGQHQYAVALPQLPAGEYFAHVLLTSKGKSLGSCATHWVVTSPVNVKEVKFDRDSYQSGQTVTAAFTLDKPLVEDQYVRALVYDNFGRHVAMAQVKVSGDLRSGTIKVTPPAPLTVLHYLVLRLWDRGRVHYLHKAEFPIVIRGKMDDFSFVGWGGGGPEFFSSAFYAKRLRDAGMDSFTIGFNAEGIRNGWKVNMRRIPYAWRVGGQHDETWNGIRKPCLTDPEYLAGERKKFLEGTEGCARYGVPGYHLGDESYYMIFDPLHGDSYCYSPTCQAGFKKFLQEMYGPIDKLNESWKTRFVSWDDFKVTSPADLRKGAPASQGDHYLYLAKVFEEAHRFAIQCIQEKDPNALVGLEGTEALYASTGIDWYHLCTMFGLQNVYPYLLWNEKAYNRHCVRSFSNPEMLLGMWYGGYPGERDEITERYYPWYSLMLGFNSIWYYDVGKPGELYNALAPDHTPVDSFRWTSAEIKEIKSGTGKLIMSTRRDNDPIAILYSQRSYNAGTLLMPEGFERRPSDFQLATSNFCQLLVDLGLQFDMVSTEQVEAGDLEKRGFKLLIMPMSMSLTPRETDQIKEFVRNGGTVVADMLTGVRDEHLVPLKQYPMDEVFGMERSASQTSLYRGGLRLKGEFEGLKMDLTLPDREFDSMLLTSGVPLGEANQAFKACIANRYGKGRAIYLGFTIDGYLRDRALGTEGSLLKLFADITSWSGITPRVRVDAGSEPLPTTEVAQFTRGALRLTMICRDPYSKDQKRRMSAIQFPGKTHLYDVRSARYLGETDRFQKQLAPGRMEVFASLQYRVDGVALSCPPLAAASDAVALRIAIDHTGRKTAPHVFHIEFRGPDGKARDCYTKNVLSEDGRCEYRWHTALNDTPGKWTAKVRDVVSGKMAEVKVELLSEFE
ncbi:MAG: beta-galactosidase trimerization domain-containing protein [Armatimonadetes bacterium]|nr:beta-galactosidase trimerization domain-containing protein [Armatimonadota bacterium]